MTLSQLLATYRTHRSITLAQRIRAYERAKPRACGVLSIADANLLADAIHHANLGG